MEITGITHQLILLIVSASLQLADPTAAACPETEAHAAVLIEMGNGPPAAAAPPVRPEKAMQATVDLRWTASLLMTGQFLTHLLLKYKKSRHQHRSFREETLLVKPERLQEAQRS
jgi:hypothetical protein